MDSKPTLRHFSHDHVLEISQYKKTKNSRTKCSACKLDATGLICTCRKCKYLIHFQCSQIPQKIQLPFHKEHILSLNSESDTFTCRACSKEGDGFSYSCRECEINIHMLCATMPPIVAHESHDHPLDLKFEGCTFLCGICKGLGMITGVNHWLYWCRKCPFYAHLSCASPKPTFAFSSSFNGTDKVSDEKESPKVNPKSTFTGSNSATSSSMASTKKKDDDGNKTKSYEEEPAGRFDVHSSGPTPKQTVPDSKNATGKDEISKNKGNANSNVTKASSYGTEDDKTKRYGPGKGGFNANSDDKTPKQTFTGVNPTTGTGKTTKSSSTPIKGKNFNPKLNYDDSDTDSDVSNDEVIDYRSMRKHKNVKSDEDENND